MCFHQTSGKEKEQTQETLKQLLMSEFEIDEKIRVLLSEVSKLKNELHRHRKNFSQG